MSRNSTKSYQCEICNSEFTRNRIRPNIRFCSKQCQGISKRTSLETYFNSRIGEPTETGCILWLSSVDLNGYGQIRKDWLRMQAHRLAWILVNGPIKNNLKVCHHCDNPLCVNVAHLFLGTQRQNMEDKVKKGRQSKGQNHYAAKLTDIQIKEILIKYASGIPTQRMLSEEYGVCQSIISEIISRKRWRHVVIDIPPIETMGSAAVQFRTPPESTAQCCKSASSSP